MSVEFCEIADVPDSAFKYAVIVARYRDKWIFCKNKNRKWELPGGHREEGEAIIDTAKRELFEETGALEFEIEPVCAYKINNFGLLYFAEVKVLGALPESEIERIDFLEDIPKQDELSFPLFHPWHYKKVKELLSAK